MPLMAPWYQPVRKRQRAPSVASKTVAMPWPIAFRPPQMAKTTGLMANQTSSTVSRKPRKFVSQAFTMAYRARPTRAKGAIILSAPRPRAFRLAVSGTAAEFVTPIEKAI